MNHDDPPKLSAAERRAARLVAGEDAWRLICQACLADTPRTPMGIVRAYGDLRHAMFAVMASNADAVPADVRTRLLGLAEGKASE